MCYNPYMEPDHSVAVIPAKEPTVPKYPLRNTNRLAKVILDVSKVKEANTPVQKKFRQEMKKQNNADREKAKENVRGIFISDDEYDVTRNTGVSVLYNPMTNVLEEKVRVIDKKTRMGYVVDVPLAVALRMKGLKFREIAKYFEMPEKVLFDAVKPYMKDDVCVELYEANRTSILQTIQARLMTGISVDKIEKASLKDIAISFGVLYDKERLQENRSTENVSLGFAGIVEGLHKRTTKQKEPDPIIEEAAEDDTPEAK